MKNYSVYWSRRAHDALAEFWLEVDDRNAVAKAANPIDRLLDHDPANTGADLHEGFRSLCIPPLRVVYEIRESDRSVEIQRVSFIQ